MYKLKLRSGAFQANPTKARRPEGRFAKLRVLLAGERADRGGIGRTAELPKVGGGDHRRFGLLFEEEP